MYLQTWAGASGVTLSSVPVYIMYTIFVGRFTDKDVLEDSSKKLQKQIEDLEVVCFLSSPPLAVCLL